MIPCNNLNNLSEIKEAFSQMLLNEDSFNKSRKKLIFQLANFVTKRKKSFARGDTLPKLADLTRALESCDDDASVSKIMSKIKAVLKADNADFIRMLDILIKECGKEN